MEKGFYNSTLGYWQTIGGEPTKEDYPIGTIEVPLRPAPEYVWNDVEWIFVKPLLPAADELRKNMPTLTARQFWLGAYSLGISKSDVLAATDAPEIHIEIDVTTEFHRTYESVIVLADLLGISPEQMDDVWYWWSAA